MNAVLTIRPDTKQLRRDLEKDVPEAVKAAAKKAEPVAKAGFRKVGTEAGDALAAELRKGQEAGLKLDKSGRWRNAKGEYASAGELMGAGLADGLGRSAERGMASTLTSLSQRASQWGDKLLKGGAMATAGLAVPMALLGKAAADTAINYEDALAANEQLFGASGLALIERWSETHAGAFNMAKSDTQSLAQGFAGYMQAYGDEQTAAQKTTELLERLADARSFYGGRIEDKASAVQAMLRGEYDPMETAFPGVSIKQSDVVARASQLGLLTVNTDALTKAQAVVAERQAKVNALEAEGKAGTIEYNKATADLGLAKQAVEKAAEGSAESLTKEARVQASLSLLYEQTAKAQGDISRTQDSAANKVEKARAAWKDLQLTLGQELLPIVAETAPKFTDMIKRLSDSGAFERLVPAIERLVSALVTLLDGFTRLPGPIQSAVMGLALFGGPLATVAGGGMKLTSVLTGLIPKLLGFTTAATQASTASQGLSGLGGAAGAGGASTLGRAGTVGAVAAGSLAVGWGIGKGLMAGTDWLREKVRGDRFPSYDSGGVHTNSGARGAHSLAWVANGEAVVPTHKYPVREALARTGLAATQSGAAGVDTASIAALAAAAAAPRTVTVVAPAGMNLTDLASEIDRIQRGAETRRLRPAANRRAI